MSAHFVRVLLVSGAALVLSTASATAQQNVLAWGAPGSWNQTTVPEPPTGLEYVEVSAGSAHGVGRLSNGLLVVWGQGISGQKQVPPLPPGVLYVEVEAGGFHNLALRSDEAVAAWGDNSKGQTDVPAPPPGLDYVEVAGGSLHSVGRLSDGSVVAWGWNDDGQTNVPLPPAGLVYAEVSAGDRFSVARLSDGSVVAWGDDTYGQTSVPAPPPGLAYVEISAGSRHIVARLSDGSVVSWGGFPGSSLPDVPALPPGVRYVEVAAGRHHNLARRSDGRVVGWGSNSYGQATVPELGPGLAYLEIDGGGDWSMGRFERNAATLYCTAGTSASGCRALLTVAGNASASAATGFVLSTSGVEGGKDGLFFYGTNGRQAISWGNGTSYRCVVPPTRRAGLLTGIGTSGLCDGYFAQDLNALWSSKPNQNPGAGSTVQAQLWYRDPGNTSNRTTSFSDGIEFFVDL
jgi:hypothetical protein